MLFRVLCLGVAISAAGCATARPEAAAPLRVPYLAAAVHADGQLDEVCYKEHAPLTAFVIAGEGGRKAAETKAWIFWSEDQLVCSFACVDSTPAWAAPVANERDVDGQDRAELFLWTGNDKGTYFCIEAAPGNAVHDYAARFYRRFDDAWSPGNGAECRVSLTPSGYHVEMILPKAAIVAMGLKLEPGQCFRMGLFRADYDRYSGQPTWITWVDRDSASPDFHVAESFGTAKLFK